MKYIIALLLAGSTTHAMAECYQLSSDQRPPLADTICLGSQVKIFQGQRLAYSIKAKIIYLGPHQVCAHTKEGPRCGMTGASYQYSSAPTYGDAPISFILDATVPVQKATSTSHGGCSGNIWVYRSHMLSERLCFSPDQPI